MSFLHEIRKQPQHHREIMFGLCVVTTISLVGMVWYNSFQKNLYVLLNPGENVDQRYLAETQNIPSLLGDIGKTGQDLKAAFYNIFNLTSNDKKDPAQSNSADRQQKGQTLNGAGIIIENTNNNDSERVYTLPISEKK